MAVVEVLMPKMGESITDATIIKWHKQEGDQITEEDTLLEVATDKVDSEIPSPVTGVLKQILYKEDDVVNIGAVIATIESDSAVAPSPDKGQKANNSITKETKTTQPSAAKSSKKISPKKVKRSNSAQSNFYSPLVRKIMKTEGITSEALEGIVGSGANGRITRSDIEAYIEERKNADIQAINHPTIDARHLANNGAQSSRSVASIPASPKKSNITLRPGDEIIEMDRMRKLIADHMILSKDTAAHVTSFAEADVTNLVNWRSENKENFQAKYGTKLTYTPIIIEIVAQAIKDFSRLNASLDGYNIILRKDINIGMATALPTGNLIVPVIHQADKLSLNETASKVNELVEKARNNKLDPSDIQNGTFTLTNIGTFNSLMGTPIINQPQLAILATGAIKKKPQVIETDEGDIIAIRHMIYLSMSYDHRVIDGYLGGSFLERVVSDLENFNDKREI